jgi:hypothetical protein
MRDRVWGLLQLEGLEVHTLALVRQDEERIQRTLGPSGLLRVALAWQDITLKTCIDKRIKTDILTRLQIFFFNCNPDPNPAFFRQLLADANKKLPVIFFEVFCLLRFEGTSTSIKCKKVQK